MEPEVERRFERIEAILEMGSAKSEERFAKHEARMEKSDARFEKRMPGCEKLAAIGMKEFAQSQRRHRQMDEKIKALIDAQQRTEAALRRFLRRSNNGH